MKIGGSFYSARSMKNVSRSIAVHSILAYSLAVLLLTGVVLSSPAFAAGAKDEGFLNFSFYGTSNSKAGKKSKKSKMRQRAQVDKKAPLALQAAQELTVASEEKSKVVMASPATVSTRVEAVSDPILRPSFRLGLSVQAYRPQGSVEVATGSSYEAGVVGTLPMVGAEARWLPIRPSVWPGASIGAFLGASFTQAGIDLRSPTGQRLDDTKLNSTKAQGGATIAWRPARANLWSLHGFLGAGRLITSQTSSSAFANSTASLDFVLSGLGIERDFSDRWSIGMVYENAGLLRPVDGATAVPRNALRLTWMGNFR